MSKCKQCGIEYEAKRATSQYCSSQCRVAHNRLSVTGLDPVSVTDLSVTPDSEVSVTGHTEPLDLSQCRHVLNAKARGQNAVNTGPWLPAEQLPPHTINRVSLPGDPDYRGVCVQVDGTWTV